VGGDGVTFQTMENVGLVGWYYDWVMHTLKTSRLLPPMIAVVSADRVGGCGCGSGVDGGDSSFLSLFGLAGLTFVASFHLDDADVGLSFSAKTGLCQVSRH